MIGFCQSHLFYTSQTLNQNTSVSSRKPNSSCFLSKICSLTSWQVCSKWWNSSHKFDKDVLLNAFWNILNESSKEERARERQTDEQILERMRRMTRAMHSNLTQLKLPQVRLPLKDVKNPSSWCWNTWCISRILSAWSDVQRVC